MSIAIQAVAGMEVFVCDNMVMRGDVIMFKRKHTTNLSLAEEVAAGVAKFKTHYRGLEGMVNGLKKAKLTDTEAKALMHDAFTGLVNIRKDGLDYEDSLPVRLLPAVSREYFEPRLKEFEPRTKWSLHNAFTEVLKELPLVPRMRHTESVGMVFGMHELGPVAA